MNKILRNKTRVKDSSPEDEIEVDCFNCGHTISIPAIRLEAINETGQAVLCRECDEAWEDDDEDEFEFIPSF